MLHLSLSGANRCTIPGPLKIQNGEGCLETPCGHPCWISLEMLLGAETMRALPSLMGCWAFGLLSYFLTCHPWECLLPTFAS